jgi:hypothetical protein
MDQDKFKKWLWLWQQGLAEEPEIQALLIEVPTDETERSRLMAQIQPIAEELQQIGLIAGARPYQVTEYWTGPDWAISQLNARVKPLISGLRCWTIGGGTRNPKEWFDHWTEGSDS